MSTKPKNHNIRCSSPERLFALKDEYENYVGRDTSYDLETLTLTVMALPKKYKKKTQAENKARRQRQERDALFTDYDEAEYDDYSDRGE